MTSLPAQPAAARAAAAVAAQPAAACAAAAAAARQVGDTTGGSLALAVSGSNRGTVSATAARTVVARAGATILGLAGWTAVGAIAISPWLLAGLPPRASLAIAACGVVAFALFVAGSVLLRRRGNVAAPCWALLAAVVALGWTTTLAARARYVSPGHDFSAAATRGTFGSVDGRASRDAMLPITGAAGVLLVVASLARDPAWRWRIVGAVLVSGAAVAAFGLIERAGGVPALVDRVTLGSPSPFGPFRYRGIAGAYLNLVLPIPIAASAALAIAGRGKLAVAAGVAAAVCLAGGIVNVSKAGMLLAVALAMATVLCLLRRARGRVIGWSVGAVMAVVVVALAVGGGEGRRRWAQFFDSPSVLGGRQIMWRICLPVAADAGAFGYGPGTFKLLLPRTPHFDPTLYRNWIVTEHVPGTETSQWGYASNDYLQGLIEWGWLGVALLGGVMTGGVVVAVRRCLSASTPAADRALVVGVLVALVGVLLHAAVDWPLQVPSIQVHVAALLGLAWGSAPAAAVGVEAERNTSCASC